MAVRPSGTVTFLFTDIESSTRLWEDHPATMQTALARHDEILRAAIDEHGGMVFATGGDGLAAVFGRSFDAVTAAVTAQRGLQAHQWGDTGPLHVRMGVHTGEAEERDGDYFGPPVNRAARLMAAAHGGQIVVSDVTAKLLGPLEGASLVELGSHRLKGLIEPMQVFGIRAEGLEWVNRPLRTEQTAPGNLPLQVTEFFGRVDVLHRRALELAKRRLVTLTGPGGVGKTRAAIEAAWLSLDEFPGGVWFVELGPIVDQGVVIAAVAASLSITPQAGLSITASIVDWLRTRRLLLILDNCEHVLDPIIELVTEVVAGCPTVTVLATSREPLGVPGERVVPIASLAVPDAAAMFRDRALAADASVEFTDDDQEAIRRICERLDGIPLAIELAAARVRSHTLADLVTRLDDRFRLLRGSSRGGMERHQTLRAAVAWSYELLSNPERSVFNRVSVFAGGFDLDAAEAVCADDTIDADDVVDLLSSLVDKSMVNADRSGRSVRYNLLETLRQYGEERITDHDESASLRDRHLAHYLAVARAAYALQMGPHQTEGEAIFDREWDNLRAAQVWTMASDALETADDLLRQTVVHALHRHNLEYVDWVERLVATERHGLPPPSRTFEAAAAFAHLRGESGRTIELCRLGIERNSDAADVAECWETMAVAYLFSGRLDEARLATEHAEEAVRSTSDARVNFWVLHARCGLSEFIDPQAMATSIANLSSFSERTGAPWMVNHTNLMRGDLCLRRKDYAGALVAYRDALAGALATRSVFEEAMAETGIISALLNQPGASPTSECRALLDRLHDTRLWLMFWVAVLGIGSHLARNDAIEAAATIAGYLGANHIGLARGVPDIQTMLETVRQHTHGAEWMARGAAMDRDQMVAFVFALLPQ